MKSILRWLPHFFSARGKSDSSGLGPTEATTRREIIRAVGFVGAFAAVPTAALRAQTPKTAGREGTSTPDGQAAAGISTLDASSVLLKAPLDGSVPISVEKMLMDREVTPQMFHEPADGDNWTSAFRKAVATGLPIRIPDGTYSIDPNIPVEGGHFSIRGNPGRVTLTNRSAVDGYIENGGKVPSGRGAPTKEQPNDLAGACFYFTSLIYKSEIYGISFEGFRFPLCYLVPHNSPTISRCTIKRCNALVFCYQGAQNYLIEDCTSTAPSGPLFIGGATCFTAGSQFAGKDNYYVDGLTIINRVGSVSPGKTANDAFDDWFIASILRPDSSSRSIRGDYVYPFRPDHDACRPSRWALIYVPMRNQRYIFCPRFEGVDARIEVCNGIGLLNGIVENGVWDGYQLEATKSPLRRHFMVGGVASALVANVVTTISGAVQVPFFEFTGHDKSHSEANKFDSGVTWIASDVTHSRLEGGKSSTLQAGINRGVVSGRLMIASASEAQLGDVYDARVDGAVQLLIDAETSGFCLTDGRMIKAGNCDFALPIRVRDGSYRRVVQLVGNSQDAAGLLTVEVLNLLTGERDLGEFYIQMGKAYSLKLADMVHNGDTEIKVSGRPPRDFQRFSRFSIGEYSFIAKSFDLAKGVIQLEGPISGLRQPISVGSTVQKESPMLSTVTPFRRGFGEIRMGGFPFVSNDTIAFGSNCSAYSPSEPDGNDESIYVSMSLSNIDSPRAASASGAPTSGQWLKGARIDNSNPKSGDFSGWICVESGRPGNWKGFGQIAT